MPRAKRTVTSETTEDTQTPKEAPVAEVAASKPKVARVAKAAASKPKEAPVAKAAASKPKEAPVAKSAASKPKEAPVAKSAASKPKEAHVAKATASKPKEAPVAETPAPAPEEAPAVEAVAPAPAIDPAAVLAQVSAQPLAEAEATLKALAAEHGAAALPAFVLAAQKGDLPLATMAMDGLAGLGTQDAADALGPIGIDRSDAARAKEARRFLHKLSLSGIKPGVVAAPAPAPAPPDKVYASLVSPIGAAGMHTVTIARQNRFGTLNMAVFTLEDTLGVVDVMGAMPCSMSLWKRYLADAEQGEQKLVPAELAFCQAQLEVAAARNERSKTPLPERYYLFSTLAMGASEERPRPAALSAETIQANPDLLAKSVELFALPECKTWLLPLDDLRPHALKMISEVRRQQQMEQGRNQESQVMDLGQLQRQGTVISMAMNALFDGARRAMFQQRLEYTADILWRSDRLEQAQWAMAAALALAPESTLPVDQHPFLREMVQHNLLAAVQEEARTMTPEALAEPGGKAADQAAQPEEYVDSEGNIRRKSGLILPR